MRVACVLLLAVALSACYQSTLPLGPPERGTIDSALVGSWSCVDPRDATNRAYPTRVGKEVLLNVEEVGPTRTKRRFVFLRARPTRGGGLSIAVVQEATVRRP